MPIGSAGVYPRRMLPTPLEKSALSDAFGRVATDLRVSLTDKCNLRCAYCMPAEGLPWLPKTEILTDDEVVRIVGLGIRRLGITKVRLTGGEPLLRPGLVEIVRRLRGISQSVELALTTNGIGLDRQVAALREAGLNRLNVSIDSVDPARFAELTRRDKLADVLAGLAAASRVGFVGTKVNAVVLRGINEPDIVGLVEFCVDQGYELRFIEQMPLGQQHTWDRGQLVTQAEILQQVSTRFGLEAAADPRGSAPAESWHVLEDGVRVGRIGVIASVTNPFCTACNRTRLTASGQVLNCLFASGETDLRGPMRDGASDDELLELWRGEQARKARGHGINSPSFEPPTRGMSEIGG